MLKNQEHSVCRDGTIRANGLKGHSPVTRIERVTGLLISHAQLGRLRLNVAHATGLIGRGFTEFFGKNAYTGEKNEVITQRQTDVKTISPTTSRYLAMIPSPNMGNVDLKNQRDTPNPLKGMGFC